MLRFILETVRSETVALPVKGIGVLGEIRVETLDGEVPNRGPLELDIFDVISFNFLGVQIVHKVVLDFSDSVISTNEESFVGQEAAGYHRMGEPCHRFGVGI